MNRLVCGVCGSVNRYDQLLEVIYDWNVEETEIKKYRGIECRCCQAKIPVEEFNVVTEDKTHIKEHEENNNNDNNYCRNSSGGITRYRWGIGSIRT